VTAAYGLTCGVVDGDVVVDSWRVARDGTIGTRAVAEKERMHVRAAGGTRAVALDPALRGRPVLDDAAVTAVASLCGASRAPRARPKTSSSRFATDGSGRCSASGHRDRGGVAAGRDLGRQQHRRELRRCGRSAHLLVARHAYAGAYRSFFRLVAVPRATIDAHGETFEGLVGRIEGRMMYDLVHWYQMLALLPATGSTAA